MRANAFRDWLDATYKPKVAGSRFSGATRVEAAYGDLDGHYDRDGLTGLIEAFGYGMADQAQQKPNPTRIVIDGDIRTGLASLKQSIGCYRRFSERGRGKLSE